MRLSGCCFLFFVMAVSVWAGEPATVSDSLNMYLFAGYSLIVGMLFVYIALLHVKLRRMSRELETLKEEIESSEKQ